MPREGAIVFSDLIGKLDAVRVTCPICGRDGRYNLRVLIGGRGGQGKIIDWLDEITADTWAGHFDPYRGGEVSR